ncbi:MAG: hypothetical protein CM15mP74_18230 [Halieaceae bacterium]|nr:MAG: hypothetical protein CM15mP74_18230 [Halieaceae bacterium]
MKYLGQSDYQHATVPRIGVLLTNLGTPEAPTAKALRPYLKQFLWDPRVVEVPRPIWWLILNGIILNTRPKRSAEAYSAVWNERGSPLLAHLEDQVAGCRASQGAARGPVRRAGCDALRFTRHRRCPDRDVRCRRSETGGLPLYPQYGGPTTGSTFDEVSSDLARRRWLPALRFISSYHDDPATSPPLQTAFAHIGRHMGARKTVAVLSRHAQAVSYRGRSVPLPVPQNLPTDCRTARTV